MTQNIMDQINEEAIKVVSIQKTSNVGDSVIQEPIKKQTVQQETKNIQSPPPMEFSVVMFGTNHKHKLFEKLLNSADKYERHIQYNDMFYLYYPHEGETYVIELNDPGLEHTGTREMAVRRADAIILCYAAYNATSFHKLASLINDFHSHRKVDQFLPVVLMCNEDDPVLPENIESSYNNDQKDIIEQKVITAQSSTSEGYASFDEQSTSSSFQKQANRDENNKIENCKSTNYTLNSEEKTFNLKKRKPSMENIRFFNEDCFPITKEQGESMARLFSNNCQFISTSFTKYDGTLNLIQTLIKQICINKKIDQKNKFLKNQSMSTKNLFSLRPRRRKTTNNAESQVSLLKRSSQLSLNLKMFLRNSENHNSFNISPLFRRPKSKNKVGAKSTSDIVSATKESINQTVNEFSNKQICGNFFDESQPENVITKNYGGPTKKSNLVDLITTECCNLDSRSTLFNNKQHTKLYRAQSLSPTSNEWSKNILLELRPQLSQSTSTLSSLMQPKKMTKKMLKKRFNSMQFEAENETQLYFETPINTVESIDDNAIVNKPTDKIQSRTEHVTVDHVVNNKKKHYQSWKFRRISAKTTEMLNVPAPLTHHSNVCTIS